MTPFLQSDVLQMPMTRHIRRSRSRDLAVKKVVDFSALDGDEFYLSPVYRFP
jgi:hypothetical protein